MSENDNPNNSSEESIHGSAQGFENESAFKPQIVVLPFASVRHLVQTIAARPSFVQPMEIE